MQSLSRSHNVTPVRSIKSAYPSSQRSWSVLAAWVAIFSLTILSGCVRGPDIDYTIPADGQTGVAPDTGIEIGFTAEMDPEATVNVENFIVFGSVSGAVMTTASLDETGRILTITPDPSFVFASGETVTVSLTNRLTTTVNVRLDDVSFSFSIAGTSANPDDFEPQDGEFIITSLSPAPGALNVSGRPVIRAQTDFPFNPQSLSGSNLSPSVVIRGTESGIRTVALNGTDLTAAGLAQSIVAQVDPSDPRLFPGEEVSVTFTDLINSPSVPDNDVANLRPYTAYFTVRGGEVFDGFSPAKALPLSTGVFPNGVIETLFTELQPEPGPEMVVLDDLGIVTVFRQDDNGVYGAFSAFADFSGVPITMRAADLDDDGNIEILVLLSNSQIEVLTVLSQQLMRDRMPIEFPGGQPSDFECADLDGNGFLDLVIGVSTGLEFIQQQLDIDLLTGNITRGYFLGLGDPLVVAVSDLAVSDLDADGRLDIVAETGGGVSVLMSAGDFLFRVTTALNSGPSGGVIRILDLDGDGNQDILTAGPDGVNAHFQSEGVIPEPIWMPTFLATGTTPVDFVAGDFSGFGERQLLIADATSLNLFTFDAQLGLSTPTELSSDIPLNAHLALGDLNRDSGRDFIVSGVSVVENSRILLSQAQNVQESPEPEFNLKLSGPSVVDLGAAFSIDVLADLDQGVETFSLGFRWDDPGVRFDRFEVSSVLDPNGSISAAVDQDIPSDLEAGVDLSLPSTLSSGEGIPVGTAYFIQDLSLLPTVLTLGLANDIARGDGTIRNNELLLESGELVFPDLTQASLSITLESSVPAVTDLTCVNVASGVELSWTNAGIYEQIRVFRNNTLLGQLPGDRTSYTVLNPSGLQSTYRVIALAGGLQSLPTECELEQFVPTPTVTCNPAPGGNGSFLIAWSEAVIYDTVLIFRNGNLVCSCLGTEFGYIDNPGPGGHQYEVQGIIDQAFSATAVCVVGDSNPGVTEPVTDLCMQASGDSITVNWDNGETYDSIQIQRLETDEMVIELPGSPVEYVDAGLLPGSYGYRVFGIRGEVPGETVTATQCGVPGQFTVSTTLPSPNSVSCFLFQGNSVQLEWVNGPDPTVYSYDSISIARTHLDDPGATEVILEPPLSGEQTSYVDVNVPDGNYRYRVIGSFGVSAPAISEGCTVGVFNFFEVSDLFTTLGQNTSFEVVGQHLGEVSDYTFAVNYNGLQFTVTDVEVPGVPAANVDWTVSGDPEGTDRQLTVTVSAVEVGGSDPNVVLAQVYIETPADFAAAIEDSLILSASSLTYSNGALISPQLRNGVASVLPYAYLLEDKQVIPGQEFIMRVVGTFAESLAAYTVAVQFDPSILTCLEVSNQGTFGELIDGPFVQFLSTIQNDQGHAAGALIAVTSNPAPPSIGVELMWLRFRVSESPPVGTTLVGFAPLMQENGVILENQIDLQGGDSIDFTEIFMVPGAVDVVVAGDPPVLQSVTPNFGPLAGGNSIELLGSGLAEDLQVFFADQPAPSVTIVGSDATQATVVVAPGLDPGEVDVRLETSVGITKAISGYTYLDQPELTSITPSSGPVEGGNVVTLMGTSFQETMTVEFGAQSAAVTFFNSTRADVTVPPALASGPVDVTLTTEFGTVTSSGGYFYGTPLAVNGVSNQFVASGQLITVFGDGFEAGLQALIGGKVALTSDILPTSIVVEVPVLAPGTVDLTVNLGIQGVTLPAALTIAGPPLVTVVDPANGSEVGGTTVLILGDQFLEPVEVFFGVTPATSVTLVSQTEIFAMSPPGVGGTTVDIEVSTPVGNATLTGAFTYEVLAVTSVTPSAGSACNPSPILLFGSGMFPDMVVEFGQGTASVLEVSAEGDVARILPPFLSDADPTGGPDVVMTVGGFAVGNFTYLTDFIRGDVNGDGIVDLADVDYLGSAISGSGPLPAMEDAADVNDDGLIHIGDVIYLSDFLFAGGAEPPPPFSAPGSDPTADGLGICP